jgi:uncharacterized phage protein (TIGR02218 family)
MARTVPGTLATHLAKGSHNTCFLITVERKDGTIERYTEADTDLTVSANLYTRLDGLMLGSIPYGLDGFSSGVDMEFGATDDTLITVEDIRDGVYDAAELTITEVDQTLPLVGGVQIFWGRIGNITRTIEGRVKMAAKGILAQSHQIVVERYSPMCIWFFCDDRCGLDPDDFTHAGTITALPDAYTLTVSGAISALADDILKDGVLEVTSGDRETTKIEIRGNSGGTVETFLAHPRGLQVGDTVEALQGCQKRFVDCQAYGNHLRFGGQPRAGSPEEATQITYIEWG